MMKLSIALTLALCVAIPAQADLLGNPYDGTTDTVALAQDFGAITPPTWPVWVVSDFQTTVDYFLYDVSAQGRTSSITGNDGAGANFDIYDGLPWDGGSLVLSATGGYDKLGSLGQMGANFDGATLPAGNYYIAFQAIHDFVMVGGNTLVYHTTTGNNNDYNWNPGQGQGYLYREILTDQTSGDPIDANWQLNAVPVPEPTCAMLLVLATGFLAYRRR